MACSFCLAIIFFYSGKVQLGQEVMIIISLNKIPHKNFCNETGSRLNLELITDSVQQLRQSGWSRGLSHNNYIPLFTHRAKNLFTFTSLSSVSPDFVNKLDQGGYI